MKSNLFLLILFNGLRTRITRSKPLNSACLSLKLSRSTRFIRLRLTACLTWRLGHGQTQPRDIKAILFEQKDELGRRYTPFG